MLYPLLAGVLLGSAQARDEPPAFTFDTVLVAPVQPFEPSVEGEAARLTRELQRRLAERVLTVDVAQVPAFESQGYDAATYVASCPRAEYTGCALVLGQRAAADWVLGGTLAPISDELLGGEGHQLFQVHFVDVRGSREVLSFGVTLGPGTPEDEVLEQLVTVFDRIVDGAFEELDIRGDLDEPAVRAQLERHREEVAAAALDALELELGALRRSEPVDVVAPAPPRLEDLQREYAQRDHAAPWERLGLTDREYVRLQRSGLPLDAWRRRARGRLGQVLIRAGFGAGGGPWGVHHEGQYLLAFDEASASFRTEQVAQYQELRQAPTTAFDGEVAVGVAPFVEVGLGLTVRSSRVTFRFDQETVGEPSILAEPVGTNVSTLALGPRVTLVPLPTLSVRPTATIGLAWWQGRGVPPQEPFQRLDPPELTLLQLAPGVETSAGSAVNLWARGMIDQPLAGRTLDRHDVGGGLAAPPVPQQDHGLGFAVQAGVQVRLTVLPERRAAGPLDDFDQEPDDL